MSRESRSPSTSSETSSAIEIGAVINERYVVISKLGAGAMGMVMAAYDRKLERRVAIKFLRRVTSERARERLRREALAMAQLNHANVVTIYDVSIHGERPFVVMEYVEGETLANWIRANAGPRRQDWRATLKIFIAAGRGLAAAHTAGFVHRDFKPDNVMLGVDGRARVMDFGLVHLGAPGPGSISRDMAGSSMADPHAASNTGSADAPKAEASGSSLTHADALVGTPAYMSPEQFLREEVTPRTDQSGFCITLHEALSGTSPFAGTTVRELSRNVIRGELRLSLDPSTPSWLRDALVRGLSKRPEDRFDSMDALLEVLEQGEAKRRRAKILAAVVSVAGLAAALAGGLQIQHRALVERCEDAGAAVEALWDDEARRALEDSLRATKVSYADATLATITPWIDAQVQALSEHETLACTRATIDESWTEVTYARASWCLAERRTELEGLLESLAQADATTVKRAVATTAQLGHVEDCTDPAMLLTMPDAPPPELRPRITELRAEVARARALRRAGQLEEALARTQELTRVAEELDDTSARAAVAYETIRAHRDVGDSTRAATLGLAHYVDAAGTGDWRAAARIANFMVEIVGVDLDRHDEARTWAEHARMALIHRGDPLALGEATRLVSLANVNRIAGDYDVARRQYEDALAIREPLLGGDRVAVTSVYTNLGNLLAQTGEHDEAERAYAKALHSYERVFGPTHPRVALVLTNLGALAMSQGALDEARRHFERARELYELNLRPDHPKIGAILSNLAALHSQLGDHERASALFERALPIFEANFGPEHSNVGQDHAMLATALERAGRDEEAVTRYQRALTILETSLGPEHPLVLDVLVGLADLQLKLGDAESARRHFEHVTALSEPPESSEAHYWSAWIRLGDTLWQLGDKPGARAAYERGRAGLDGLAELTADLVELRERAIERLARHER